MQGRQDRQEATQWHYADARQRTLGPYPAEAIARLFQFGHIHAGTRVWREDPAGARPLRECREAFDLGPGGRIRIVVQPPPTAAEPPATAPPDAPPPAAAEPARPASPPPVQVSPDPDAGPARPPPTSPRARWRRPALALLALLAVIVIALRFVT